MKQLKNKNLATNLICHQLAVPAFELTQAIFLSSPIPLSLHKLLLLSRARRFMCFERDGKYVFFSGWIPLLLEPDNLRNEVVKTGPSYIEFQAWLYALESILILSNKNSLILNLALFFIHVPNKVKSRLFISGAVPNTIQAQLVEFTGESRATIRHYLRKMESV